MAKRKCPNCEAASDIFTVVGTLVTGQVSIRIGSNGLVQAVGPIRPRVVLKQGRELAGKFNLTCPKCGHTARPDDFIQQEDSIISGEAADAVFDIPELNVKVPLRAVELDQAREIFNANNFRWDSVRELMQLLELPYEQP